jgi:hypothetical protein
MRIALTVIVPTTVLLAITVDLAALVARLLPPFEWIADLTRAYNLRTKRRRPKRSLINSASFATCPNAIANFAIGNRHDERR